MKIALSENTYSFTQKEIAVVGYIEEYLLARGLVPVSWNESKMSTFDLYDVLLVPPYSKIRPVKTDEIISKLDWNEQEQKYVNELFEQKYGIYPQEPIDVSVSTTTAVLIHQILKGKMDKNAFLSLQVDRKNSKMLEMEIVLFGKTMEEAICFFEEMIGHIVEECALTMNSTFFSWASMAVNFRSLQDNTRFGAMGILKKEILSLNKEMENETVILLGVPVTALANGWKRK